MKYLHTFLLVCLMSFGNFVGASQFSLKQFKKDHPDISFCLGFAAMAGGAAGSAYLANKVYWWWLLRKPAQEMLKGAGKIHIEISEDLKKVLNQAERLNGAGEAEELLASRKIEAIAADRYSNSCYPTYKFVCYLNGKMRDLDWQDKLLEAKLAQGDSDALEMKGDIEELMSTINDLYKNIALVRNTLMSSYRYKYEVERMNPRTVYVHVPTPGIY